MSFFPVWLYGPDETFKKLYWPDGAAPEATTDPFDMNVVSLSYVPGNYYVGTYSLGLR